MLLLKPKEEALLLCYILFFDRCTTACCRTPIADIIRTRGSLHSRTVYRGQVGSAGVIRTTTPFLSASPTVQMAKRYASPVDPHAPNGDLFKIHLRGVPCLSTRHVWYTLSPSVLGELRDLTALPLDGEAARLERNVRETIFKKGKEEWLVLNGGTFYKDAARAERGFQTTRSFLETWYWL
jgi:hypothetical protein